MSEGKPRKRAASLWKPGQSGNPKGKPKKECTFTGILSRVLDEKTVNYKGEMIPGKEAAARKLLELAISGDVGALKYLADRIDGTPRQSVEVSGADGGPVAIRWEKA